MKYVTRQLTHISKLKKQLLTIASNFRLGLTWWQQEINTALDRLDRNGYKRRRWYRRLRIIPGLSQIVDYLLAVIWVMKMTVISLIYLAKPGQMSWHVLFVLSTRNLKARWSRTVVTGGAISIGIAAIIFLVSFGYGLQNIVTTRLIHPNSLRLIDVQSDSTALKLDQNAATMMMNIGQVADVAKTVSLAGSVTFGNQKTEAVVIGTENKYLEYDNVQLVTGEFFSTAADAPYQANGSEVNQLLALTSGIGQVAGVTDEAEYNIGDQADEKPVQFRAPDDSFVPVYAEPNIKSKVIGYLRGSVLASYEGRPIWGHPYQSTGVEGRNYRKQDGEWLGKWLEAKVPTWKEVAPTVYLPDTDEVTGEYLTKHGYVPTGAVETLSPLEFITETLSTTVLGISTPSALVADGSATESASLQQLLVMETSRQASSSASGGVVEVARKEGKEILVSTGLLSLLKLEPEQALQQKLTLTMIVSGGLIPGITGRVSSNQVEYTVVGIINNDAQPTVMIPLGEVTSMGVDRYSLIKVLTDSNDAVKGVRERIEALGYLTQSLSDTLQQVDRLFRMMRFLLGAVGMIALAVALLGMFNTLTISLMERTREIGVMKTLGTTNRDVVRLYIVESMVLGLGGGIFGSAAGVILGELIDLIFGIVRQSWTVGMFVTPTWLFLIMLVVATLVGLLTGILPAKRATQISALNALRYE